MQVLVSDASILIELAKWSLLEDIFQLPFEFAVPDALFDEELIDLGGMDRHDLIPLGLRVETLDAAGVQQAIDYQSAYPKLTIYDCFAVTLAEQKAWRLLTSDRRMKNLAVAEKVESFGTLWIIDRLVEHGVKSALEVTVTLEGMMIDPKNWIPQPEIKKRIALLKGTES